MRGIEIQQVVKVGIKCLVGLVVLLAYSFIKWFMIYNEILPFFERFI